MKRLVIYPLMALAVALAFVSCMKKFDTTPDPLDPGRLIFSCAQGQQRCAMDGANIAFRLNILLTEIKRQMEENSGAEIKLNDVKYTYTGADKQYSLNALLFGSGSKTAVVNDYDYRAKIDSVSGSPGDYRITYPSYYKNSRDSWREGVVEIRTLGKLLNELDDTLDEYWEVRNVSSKKIAWVSYDVYGDPAEYILMEYGDYRIYHAAGVYTVSANSFSSRFDHTGYDQYASDWNLNVTIETNMTGEWDCNDVMSNNMVLKMKGGGSGVSMYILSDGYNYAVQAELAYTIEEPLIYNSGADCNGLYNSMNIPFIFHSCGKGSVDAKLRNYTSLGSFYPSGDVSVEWKPRSGSCVPDAMIDYNGQIAPW